MFLYFRTTNACIGSPNPYLSRVIYYTARGMTSRYLSGLSHPSRQIDKFFRPRFSNTHHHH